MSVTFTCNATGIPVPTIVWFRNNTEFNTTASPRVSINEPTDPVVVSSPTGNILSVGRELVISDTMDQDSGTYSCVGSNEVGSVEQEFELFVGSKCTYVHLRTALEGSLMTICSHS